MFPDEDEGLAVSAGPAEGELPPEWRRADTL